ncbi:uncharacterized protein [Miscanthus floridulus]|uniref:uncharacterized protein n=1 Tax=Miscanthus floridulus TaxID=154761 RepID=UPI00345A9171
MAASLVLRPPQPYSSASSAASPAGGTLPPPAPLAFVTSLFLSPAGHASSPGTSARGCGAPACCCADESRHLLFLPTTAMGADAVAGPAGACDGRLRRRRQLRVPTGLAGGCRADQDEEVATVTALGARAGPLRKRRTTIAVILNSDKSARLHIDVASAFEGSVLIMLRVGHRNGHVQHGRVVSAC